MSSYYAAIALALLGLLTTTLHAASDRHVAPTPAARLGSRDESCCSLDDPEGAYPHHSEAWRAEGVRVKRMECSYLDRDVELNHTTLVTGVHPAKHGVIGNDYFDRKELKKVPFIPDPIFNKDEIVLSPTIYDVAKQAGLSTAGIICARRTGSNDTGLDRAGCVRAGVVRAIQHAFTFGRCS